MDTCTAGQGTEGWRAADADGDGVGRATTVQAGATHRVSGNAGWVDGDGRAIGAGVPGIGYRG